MNGRLTRAKAVVVAIVSEARSENITFMAGSIAYHAFVSLLPLLLLVLFVVSRVGGEDLAQQVLTAGAGYLTPGAVTILKNAAVNAARSGGLSAIGLAVLVWGTLRIFRGFDQAFSDIYESEATNTLPNQILDGIVVFGGIGLSIFVLGVVETVVAIPSVGPADTAIRPTLSVLAIAVALLPMYYIFPDEDVTLLEVVPGALVAGVGWTVLSEGFRFYVRFSSKTDYGVVGVVILFITWLYIGGFFLLLGAAVNAVLAGRSRDVSNIAWGRWDDDATAGDASFVAPLRDLEDVKWKGEVRVVANADGAEVADVTLPRPEAATVTVEEVDRPAVMGGNREAGRLVLEWDSNP